MKGEPRKLKIYVASPLGFFKEAGDHFYHEKLIPAIREAVDCEIVDPWEHSHHDTIRTIEAMPAGKERKRAWENLDVAVAREDLSRLRRSDGVVAYLNGSDVDSGVAFEMGYAHALGKLVVGYRDDFRQAGENEGCDVNLMVEFPIKGCNRKLATTLEELKDQVKEVFGKRK